MKEIGAAWEEMSPVILDGNCGKMKAVGADALCGFLSVIRLH